MNGSTITAISQEAFPSSRQFIDVEIFASTNQNLLFEVTAIVEPVKTDFSEHWAVGESRMTVFQPASGVGATMIQLDAFICHPKSCRDNKGHKKGHKNGSPGEVLCESFGGVVPLGH